MENYWVKFIMVVISVTITDICWTYYFIEVDGRRSVAASLWASLIVGLGAFSAYTYVNDHSLIVAAVIGSFIGTYASIEHKKSKEKIIK